MGPRDADKASPVPCGIWTPGVYRMNGEEDHSRKKEGVACLPWFMMPFSLVAGFCGASSRSFVDFRPG
ncbi:MAG: hypothetical protein JWR26_4862 [Pedosphaera sp.]|nr:hypothetical protein [Pedosphaera sp.]